MRLRELVASPLGLTAVTGSPALDRELAAVVVTDLPDPSRYLRGGELVVSGLVWLGDQRKSAAQHCEVFVGALAAAGCAGLAAGDTTDAPPPYELVDACARHGLPLLHVPARVAFAELTDWINRRISAERVGDAGELLARHRRLLGGAGQGVAGTVSLIGQETGMAWCVITATGELVAAHGDGALTADARAAVARESLRTAGQPERLVEYRSVQYSVYTVPGRPGTAITDWYALFEGDWRSWSRQRREAARGAARLVGAERTRIADSARPLRRVGRELVALAAEGGSTAQIGARLSVVGIDPSAGLRAVAVATAGDVRIGRLARVLMEGVTARDPLPIAVFPPERTVFDLNAVVEAHAAPDSAGDPWREAAFAVALAPDPRSPDSAHAVADVGDAASGGASSALDDGSDATAGATRLLRSRLTALAPGLGRDRVAVGLSGRFTHEADLSGAIEEARLAMRLAMRRPGRLELAEHDELASHLVLLAHVPDELRRAYRDRLLGPLRAYDERHHSRLEETLDRFLCCSASWSRCAQELHIHVNTLRYRVDKINQLTGRDLGRLDHQVDFYLALRAR